MAGSSWRWYIFIVQVLKQQQQKKKMEKKDQKKKKRKKKASLRLGQSILQRLLTHVGVLVAIFFVLCLFFVPGGRFSAPFCRTAPHPHHTAQLVLNRCSPF